MPPLWQQTAPVRDFDLGNVRFGSFATDARKAKRPYTSALPPIVLQNYFRDQIKQY